MALRLKLRPGERVLVGGAVVRNGSARTELFVENDTPVLREPDVLRPQSVRTPCERIYLALQIMYVDVHSPSWCIEAYRELSQELLAAAPSFAPLILAMDELLEARRMFQALRQARRLIEHERELLSHAS